jgi:hypothetical protein
MFAVLINFSCKSVPVLLIGITPGGLYCIRFGLVTADTDLEELIGMVVAAGKEIEESSKVKQVSFLIRNASLVCKTKCYLLCLLSFYFFWFSNAIFCFMRSSTFVGISWVGL